MAISAFLTNQERGDFYQKMARKRRTTNSNRTYVLVMLVVVVLYYIFRQSSFYIGIDESSNGASHDILLKIAREQNGNNITFCLLFFSSERFILYLRVLILLVL